MNKLMQLYYTYYNHMRFFQFCLFLAGKYQRLKNRDLFYASNDEIEQFAVEYSELKAPRAKSINDRLT